MILFPPAKINLGLNVLFKREDGYHELDTCMVPIPFTDVLELLPAEEFSFHQSGLFIPGNSEDNLCIKAYRSMVENFSISPVYIHLRKEIPMGAGLGGGSADAAYVLKGIKELFNVDCSTAKLEELAAQLGSDCPFFIKNQAQIAKGRGELLSSCNLDLKGYYIKIVNPGIHIGTKEAYAGIVFGKNERTIQEIVEGPIENWRMQLKNDFETTAFALHPELIKIKEKLYAEGAVYAAMSGSGSTMFGIYKVEPKLTFTPATNYLEIIRKF
jgi:4-diphosphocytidyl-2-C-methyl-D-erythritol kinase